MCHRLIKAVNQEACSESNKKIRRASCFGYNSVWSANVLFYNVNREICLAQIVLGEALSVSKAPSRDENAVIQQQFARFHAAPLIRSQP